MDGTQTVTSLSLLERVGAGGDEAACAEFVRRYRPMVQAIARACRLPVQECDDLAQEVMMGAIDALRSRRYDRQQGRFKAFLKGVIYHKIDHARRSAAKRAALADRYSELTVHGETAPAPDAEFEQAFDHEWQKLALDEVLDQIRGEFEPETFQAFDLVVNKGWKPLEVAKQLGMSRNAVYIAKSRIEGRLREMLQRAE